LETKKLNVWDQKLNYHMRFYENIWYYATHYLATITHPHKSNLHTVMINQILLFNDHTAVPAMLQLSSAVI